VTPALVEIYRPGFAGFHRVTLFVEIELVRLQPVFRGELLETEISNKYSNLLRRR
jgi:hypothetical protein